MYKSLEYQYNKFSPKNMGKTGKPAKPKVLSALEIVLPVVLDANSNN